MGLKIVGVEKIQKKLRKNMSMEQVEQTVKLNGSEMQTRAQRKAPVDSGNLKRSIGCEITDGGLTAEVEPKAEYGAYVELGTRFMEAQPYLKPAFEEQKKQFRKDMEKLVR